MSETKSIVIKIGEQMNKGMHPSGMFMVMVIMPMMMCFAGMNVRAGVFIVLMRYHVV